MFRLRYRGSCDAQWLTDEQLPKARLVSRRRLVLTTRELESEYSSHGRSGSGYRCIGLGIQRGA